MNFVIVNPFLAQLLSKLIYKMCTMYCDLLVRLRTIGNEIIRQLSFCKICSVGFFRQSKMH